MDGLSSGLLERSEQLKKKTRHHIKFIQSGLGAITTRNPTTYENLTIYAIYKTYSSPKQVFKVNLTQI